MQKIHTKSPKKNWNYRGKHAIMGGVQKIDRVWRNVKP